MLALAAVWEGGSRGLQASRFLALHGCPICKVFLLMEEQQMIAGLSYWMERGLINACSLHFSLVATLH